MTSFCLSSTQSSFMTNQRNDKTTKKKKKKINVSQIQRMKMKFEPLKLISQIQRSIFKYKNKYRVHKKW